MTNETTIELLDQPTKQLPDEPCRAYSALMYFLQLGPTRNLTRAAQGSGLSYARIRILSGRYFWMKRALAYDRHWAQKREQIIEDATRNAAQDWASRVEARRQEDWASAARLRSMAGRILDELSQQDKLEKLKPFDAAKMLHLASVLASRATEFTPLDTITPAQAPSASILDQIHQSVQRIYGEHLALVQPIATNHKPAQEQETNSTNLQASAENSSVQTN